jgi:choline dehydrogenase-like flavoprotein
MNVENNSNAKHIINIGYHPIGTISIGSNEAESVVDKNLKLWKISNLYICSTAIFPTSGSSNTGLTLLALTARLATHLKNIINLKYI